jgi:pimeloyl-ACP methyl ester carboxylesterase
VLISFEKPVWLLTKYAGKVSPPKDATLQNFKDVIVPFLENKFKLPKPYIARGHSMGGANVANLCSGLDIFSACIMTNPALLNTDPWDGMPGPQNWFPARFIVQSQLPADVDLAKKIWFEESFIANVKNAKALPKTFVASCKADNVFNLHAATVAWVNTAKAKGFDVTFVQLGKNCDHLEIPEKKVQAWLIGK